MSPAWVDRIRQTEEPPPRNATTAAWREYAETAGHTVPDGAGRAKIIELVDAGPPPSNQPTVRSAVSPRVEGAVYTATKASVDQADHLTPLDDPVVAVLLDLARAIDGFELRPANAPMDNVTVPTFLRYAESLGLSPMARAKLDIKPQEGPSKLAHLRAIRGGRAAG